MSDSIFPPHNLNELSVLGLLREDERLLLYEAGITGLNEILDHYEQHQSFYSLQGCSQERNDALKDFAEKYLFERNHLYTAEELFSDSFHSEGKFFVPVIIDWDRVSGRSKNFLDTWINYVVNWYQKPKIIPAGYSMVFEIQLGREEDAAYLARRKERNDFLDSYLGKDIDAKRFYEIAILHPDPELERYKEDHTISRSLFYLRSTFLKYYKATQVLSDPLDLLRFFARNEFFLAPDHKVFQKIAEHQARRKKFPFARAVYGIVSNSSFFSRRRGLTDMNMMRFVSIFNQEPYWFGIMNELFGMSQAAFDKLQADSDAVAENGCRITISILKALGFKHYYPENRYNEDQKLNPVLISNINYLENLFLPESFYKLLFEELFEEDLAI